jgi:hypothetical protein
MGDDTLVTIILIIIIWFSIVPALCRWIFRVNQIVDLLKKIDANTTKEDHFKYLPSPKEEVPVIKQPPPEGYCDACTKYFPLAELSTIKVGGLTRVVCPTCKKFLKS